MYATAMKKMLDDSQSSFGALGIDDDVLAGLVHNDFDADDVASRPGVALAGCLMSEAIQVAAEGDTRTSARKQAQQNMARCLRIRAALVAAVCASHESEAVPST